MNKLVIKGIYKHFKGDYYLVEDTAISNDTEKEVVIYRGLYDKCHLYTRDKEDFLSLVDKEKYPNIKQKYKFELQSIERINKK